MPIPKYEEVALPLLEFLGDRKDYRLNYALEHLSKLFNLTEQEMKELLLPRRGI